MARFICAALFILVSGISGVVHAEQLKIGVLAPLSGPAALPGTWLKQGVELARREHGKGLEIFFEDDQCSGKGALSAYRKLVSQGLRIILGPLCNAAAIPLIEPARADGVTLITTGLATESVRRAGDHVFTLLPSVSSIAEAIAKRAVTKERRKQFAVLYVPDEFGDQNAEAFKKMVESYEGRVVLYEQLDPQSLDYRSFLTRAKKVGADAFFIAAYVPQYLSFFKQAAQVQSKLPIFAVPTVQSASVLTSREIPLLRLVYSYPGNSQGSLHRVLQEKYKKLHPEELGIVPLYVGAGYDGIKVLQYLALQCPDGAQNCFQSSLKGLEGFSGVNGSISFDAEGNLSRNSEIEIRLAREGGIELLR